MSNTLDNFSQTKIIPKEFSQDKPEIIDKLITASLLKKDELVSELKRYNQEGLSKLKIGELRDLLYTCIREKRSKSKPLYIAKCDKCGKKYAIYINDKPKSHLCKNKECGNTKFLEYHQQ